MVDRRSDEAAAYRKLYKQARWKGPKGIRARRLRLEPICRMCKAIGRIEVATIVDHIQEHKGNAALFFDLHNTQSLCKPHHDGTKQSTERMGFSNELDESGYPIDPRHPAREAR